MPEWTFAISPVAASRPRVSKHGAYFTGPYKQFRQDMINLIPDILGDEFVPFSVPISVDIEFYCKQPNRTKLTAPRADIDNYLKAAFDSMNGNLWDDDTLIQKVYATKQWAPKSDGAGYFTIGVEEIE